MGYSLQIEQAESSELERYSAYVTVSRSAATGRFEYSTDIGGDRGGGKRFEKPPEGLFDEKDGGEIPDSKPTEPPAETPTVPPTENPTVPPTETIEKNSSASGSGEGNTPEAGCCSTVPNTHDGNLSHTAILKTAAPVYRSKNVSDPLNPSPIY